VILERCRETEIEPIKSAKITKAQRVEQTEKLEVDFETENDNYPRVLLGLPGRHQAENAATAIAIAESLRNAGFKISRENIIAGLEKAKHAGRLEFWSNQPQILFDGAHNAAGSQALREFLQEFTKKPMTLVFSAMRDKDLAEIAEKLFPLAEKLILTRADNSRSAAPEKLREVVPADFVGDNIYLASTLNEALRLAFKLTPTNGLICVTGSLYLVGEAQSALIKLKN
jgi:dihydrofolate synthase/folylpolyglutamate synthase